MKNKLKEICDKAISEMPYVDKIYYEDDSDNSINYRIYLPKGITLIIAKFIDEPIDSPCVFSIYSETSGLLVADMLSLEEICKNIKTIYSND